MEPCSRASQKRNLTGERRSGSPGSGRGRRANTEPNRLCLARGSSTARGECLRLPGASVPVRTVRESGNTIEGVSKNLTRQNLTLGNLTGRQIGLASIVVVLGLALCACGTEGLPAAQSTRTTTPTGSTGSSTTVTAKPTAAELAAESDGAAPADTDSSGVEWLCRPGQADDPCATSLTTTVLPASGPTYVEHFSDASSPKIDCFYVYPTVSLQPGIVANLHIDPAEISVAEAQASRFSQVCRVFAPIYPQLTLHALADPGGVTAVDEAKAYGAVAKAWDDYMAHYNDGRGVVVIGHSQGAAMLIALLRRQVDDNPSVRRQLVSAIIAGGNVTVPIGKDVGGSFQHIPACRTGT